MVYTYNILHCSTRSNGSPLSNQKPHNWQHIDKDWKDHLNPYPREIESMGYERLWVMSGGGRRVERVLRRANATMIRSSYEGELGSGEAAPPNIAVLPVLFEGDVLGRSSWLPSTGSATPT